LTDRPGRTSSGGSAWWLWAGAAAAVCATLVRGYRFGVEDQALYLPFVLHWIDPSLFAGDYLLAASWAKESLVWPFLAATGKWFSLKAMFFGLHFLCTLVLFAFLFGTAMEVWRRVEIAWLAVLLWLPAYEIPGAGINTFDDYFTTRSVGFVIAAAGLYLLVRGRHWLAASVLAGGCFIHVLSVLPPMAGLVVSLLLERKVRDAWRVVLFFAGTGLLFLVYTRFLGARHDLFMRFPEETRELLWTTFPDLFPQGWSFSTWLGAGVYLGIFGLAFLCRWRCGTMGQAERRVFSMGAGAALSAVLGLAGTWSNLALFPQLSLLRGLYWLVLVTTLIVAAEGARWLESPKARIRMAGVYLLSSWIMGAVGAHAVVFAVMAACVLRESPALGPPVGPLDRIGGLAWVLMGLLVLLQAYWMIVLPAMGFCREANGLPVAILACATVGIASRPPIRVGGASAVRVGALWLGILTALVLFPTEPMVHLSGKRPALSAWFPSLEQAVHRTQANRASEASRRRMAEAVQAAVPKGDTVVVPPDWTDFRVLTGRASFVTRKDFCGALYDRSFRAEWMNRMDALKIPYGRGGEETSVFRLREEEWRALSGHYAPLRLNFLITSEPLSLPKLAASQGLFLYWIGESPADIGQGSNP